MLSALVLANITIFLNGKLGCVDNRSCLQKKACVGPKKYRYFNGTVAKSTVVPATV